MLWALAAQVASAASPEVLLASVLPLPGGDTYVFTHFVSQLFVGGCTDVGTTIDCGVEYDYTLEFDVSPVPLPAALPLFGSALAMLGIVGWRRRR